MDSKDLLEQEEAFHQLNAEIELKTRKLMKKMECVLNAQNDLKNWPPDYLTDDYDLRSISNGRFSAECMELDSVKSPVGCTRSQKSYSASGWREKQKKKRNLKKTSENPLIPPCAKGLSAENLSRFLKAKGKLLQEELEQTRKELQIKTEECKKMQQELKSKEEDRVKSTADIATLREKCKKQENHITSLTEKLQLRDSENAILKKEIDMLKQEMKKHTLTSSGQESRLNKVKEENEKLKHHLKQLELSEKESRDKLRKKSEDMTNFVRKLEKQKSELINTIKKQVILIENLKKQKGLIETEGALNFTEKEFMRILEGKFDEEKR